MTCLIHLIELVDSMKKGLSTDIVTVGVGADSAINIDYELH